ncbi:GNAT family N-acetyltransferase [Marivibrio halodurans]|uniref:GNAT family N-acetyltransferase n=1 Tax=Marivibrio halodurans TaxID=2039722 RepID=A0A8J7S2P8_9PROT|nr:GNAT family N-acetyltransferase [Marivibrio halodurans]MBP5858775.1 GNAT family N-acetyltransferase [Marivibrio halodurans]
MTVTIREVRPQDFGAWSRLYRGYGDFYKVAMTEESLATVWSWLTNEAHLLEGLVAEREGALLGLAHFRAMPSPLRATTIGFLDDLFVDPPARGARVGEALFDRLKSIAAERGWPRIRWITADDNYRARVLYDRIGAKTSWNLYEFTA